MPTIEPYRDAPMLPHPPECPCFECWAYAAIRRLETENAELRERMKFPPPKGTLYGDPDYIREIMEKVKAHDKLDKALREEQDAMTAVMGKLMDVSPPLNLKGALYDTSGILEALDVVIMRARDWRKP